LVRNESAQDPWSSRLRLGSRCGCADGPPLRDGRLQLFGPDIALPAKSETMSLGFKIFTQVAVFTRSTHW
jgi:hypothetical protein